MARKKQIHNYDFDAIYARKLRAIDKKAEAQRKAERERLEYEEFRKKFREEHERGFPKIDPSLLNCAVCGIELGGKKREKCVDKLQCIRCSRSKVADIQHFLTLT